MFKRGGGARRLLTVSMLRYPGNGFYWSKRKKDRYVPFVRLSGDWLEQVGFPIGRQIRVTVEPGRLVLEAMEV
jgi:toxic protein SymE